MNSLSIAQQAGALRSYFPDSRVTTTAAYALTWVASVTPKPLCDTYQLRLHYVLGHRPHIFVVEPKLVLAPGWTKLKHVWSTERQELCVYYPKWHEWHPGLYLVKTVVPWASEWLYHYEIWAGTGVWHGGGIEHDEEQGKK
jgi:hypothetical protein